MRPALVLLMALASTGLAIAGCSYDPQFADGALMCSAKNECPENYTCRGNVCVSNRGGGGGMAGTPPGGTGGSGGGPIAPAEVVARYIGTWTLGPTSAVMITCDDGFMDTTLVSPPTMPTFMTITQAPSGPADLATSWLCPVRVRVNNNGAHLFDPAPRCSKAAAAPLQMQTWTATRFDIVANTALAAMHSATYTRVDVYNNGAMVTCTQTVTAPMTK